MKIKDYKCICGSEDFFFADEGGHTGIYCSYCGKWKKWADKDERNLSMKQEQKTGKWIQWNYPGCEHTECSVCKTEYDQIDLYIGGSEYPNYCPNCGARMELEEK